MILWDKKNVMGIDVGMGMGPVWVWCAFHSPPPVYPQYNLHKKATGLAHQTACLRDQLVADHGSLRQAEARLKGVSAQGV